jgi:hypothetical protein
LVTDPQTDWDIWVLPLDAERNPGKPSPFLKTSFAERSPQFSPDGRWVAYASNQSGRFEIYVRPFAAPGGSAASGPAPNGAGTQWQLSTAGGIAPRWRPDGKEVYYLGPDGQMMAAPIAVNGTAIVPGTPLALFQSRVFGGGTENNIGRQYDVAPDGRFLINTVLQDVAAPITILQNWQPPAK